MRTTLSWGLRAVVRYLIAGAMALLPLVLTIAVVVWMAGSLAGFVGPDAAFGRLLSRLGLVVSSDGPLAYAFG